MIAKNAAFLQAVAGRGGHFLSLSAGLAVGWEECPPVPCPGEELPVNRFLVAAALFAGGVLAAQPVGRKADTPEAAATRKVLAGKISVDFKDTPIKDALEEIKDQCREAKLGKFSYLIDTGVSMNLGITYQAQGKTVAEVLDGMFKKNGLGYVVVTDEKPSYKGAVLVRPGKERGYPEGQPPAKAARQEPPKAKARPKDEAKPADKAPPADDPDKAERMAQSKLKLTKELIREGVRRERVKERLKELLQDYPKTRAAKDAQELLDKLNK
jgi:hypothetical protein